jgi:beta-mannanase
VLDIVNNKDNLDAWLHRVADEIRKYLNGQDGVWGNEDDRRLFISLGAEFNGDWESGYNVSNAYKDMWRHIVGIFREHLPLNYQTRLQFVWTAVVQDSDSKGHNVTSYYPGHDLVDWIGLDGYNWKGKSNWLTPQRVFNSMLRRLRKLAPSKPFAVVETGTTSLIKKGKNCSNSKRACSKKNAWIKQAIKYFRTAKFKMVIWFQQNKEHDWSLFNKRKCWTNWKKQTTYEG